MDFVVATKVSRNESLVNCGYIPCLERPHAADAEVERFKRDTAEQAGMWGDSASDDITIQHKGTWDDASSSEEGLIVECRDLVPCDTSTSGVYFVKDSKGNVAGVFKPAEQEYVPEEMREAIVQGENMYRERAAYILSRELGYFGSVPTTLLATMRHPSLSGGEQRGSLQRFVADAEDMSDMGPDGLPDDEVHKVGMLDIILMNMDRHEGNILVTGGGALVPIDHGLCLPRVVSPSNSPDTVLLQQLSFVWQGWRQASRPFGESSRRLALSLTPASVASLAGRIVADTPGLSPQALTTLKVGATVVRVCVGNGMTLSEVAAFVVTGGLGRALASAWEVDEGGVTRGYGAWERRFLERLEAELQVAEEREGRIKS